MIRLLTLVTLLLLKAPSGAPLGFLGPAPFATTAAGALGSVGAALPSIVASSLLAVDVVSSGLHSSLPAPEAARRGAETIAAIAAPGSVTARAVALESDRRHVACVARSAPDDFNYECQQDASPQVVVRGGRLIVVSQTWTAPPSQRQLDPLDRWTMLDPLGAVHGSNSCSDSQWVARRRVGFVTRVRK